MARFVSLLLAATVATGTPGAVRIAAAEPAGGAELDSRHAQLSHEKFAAALLAETNRVRRAHALRPLRWQRPLNSAADDQAAIMMMTTNFSHLSPIRGQRTPADRVRRHGYEAAIVAENIAWYPVGEGDEPPSAARVAALLVEQWMNSPGHRANLLNPNFTHLGSSVRLARFLGKAWTAYGVQVFAQPRHRSRFES